MDNVPSPRLRSDWVRPLRRALLALVAPFWILQPGAGWASQEQTPSLIAQYLADGTQSFVNGSFDAAVEKWSAAAGMCRAQGLPAMEEEALGKRAEAYGKMGFHRRAVSDLQAALTLAEASGDAARKATVSGALGNAYFAAGQSDQAIALLTRSIATARGLNLNHVIAADYNNLGNAQAATDQTDAALESYERARHLALSIGDSGLAATAAMNAAGVLLDAGKPRDAQSYLSEAQQSLAMLPVSQAKAMGLVRNGHLLSRFQKASPDAKGDAKSPALKEAFAALNTAADVASTVNDRASLAYALGYLGELYEGQRRFDEALALTRRAAFVAQEAELPENLYLWQWQAGRILQAQGAADAAIDSLRQAAYTLRSISQDLTVAQQGRERSFRQVASPLFLQYTDLLLRRASHTTEGKAVNADLIEARDMVELLKAAELQDYFQDECVAQLQAKTTTIDTLPAGTAAIYPIFLPDRMELLVSTPAGLKQVTANVGEARMTEEIRQFRLALERRNSNSYRRYARQLYDWIIRPIEPVLEGQKIATLVVIPEGALRTIPLAALLDEKSDQYLVEKYAIATAPGLTLIDPQPITRKDVAVLAGGLTESVQGFPALPSVAEELTAIKDMAGGKVLSNEAFKISTVERELKTTPYTIVHVASHGEFNRDPAKSFLLAYDGKLNMNQLEQFVKFGQFRDDPLELLTLSACQTAAGDDRAALGLAGVAVKAGARSALATLWFINDQASSELVERVYDNLLDEHVSKARALQLAQISFLKDRTYRHPSYWSPFLLIGNWL